jgi:hypothetical protein
MKFSIEDKLVHVGSEAVQYYPPIPFINLRIGLLHYYETYSIIRGKANFPYFKINGAEHVLESERTHSYISKYFITITSIHSFYEHLLNNVLDSGKLQLSYIQGREQDDFVALLAGKHEVIKIGGKTLDYNVKLKRLALMYKLEESIPLELRLSEAYKFLLNHINTLEMLALLRNDIVHKGDRTLLRYDFECFMVNKIIPLLVDTLTLLAKSKVYIQKALYCKLNVLEELRKLTLPFEVKDIIYSEINEKLKHINHLKELGRASFSNPLWMKADAISDEHWKNIKSQHNDSIVFEAMQQAEKLLGISGYFFSELLPLLRR